MLPTDRQGRVPTPGAQAQATACLAGIDPASQTSSPEPPHPRRPRAKFVVGGVRARGSHATIPRFLRRKTSYFCKACSIISMETTLSAGSHLTDAAVESALNILCKI